MRPFSPRHGRRRFVALLLAAALGGGALAALADTAEPTAGYRYFAIGDTAAPAPAAPQPGLLLVGGGDWPRAAFRWFAARAGHGRIVILRASGTVEAQQEFFNDVGGITAAQTLVFSDRRAAADPRVLEIVGKADGIFIAGGDQANYVRHWQGTPLNRLLDAHVRSGRPLGGTSAGLAILGEYAYGALDGGSQSSADALADPAGAQATLVGDFLHLAPLARVVTDSHFDRRSRQGRLIAWLARLAHEHGRDDLVGLGIDEYTALCIDADGRAQLHSGNGGHAWLLRPQQRADVYAAGQPLTLRGVAVTGIGTGSTMDMKDFRVERPAFQQVYDVQAGRLRRREPAAVLGQP